MQLPNQSYYKNVLDLYFSFAFSDWLVKNDISPEFEEVPDKELCNLLRKFFVSAVKKDRSLYSKSGMVNIRSGINHYLCLPPYNRKFNIMQDQTFQLANTAFRGTLRLNKQAGADTSQRRSTIEPGDLELIYINHLNFYKKCPLHLQYKV